jgi:NADH-quinone oxidoreductase subunit M
MDTLISPPLLRVLLLAVLFAPLAFAAVVALTGDRFRVARRLAGLLCVLHLAVTLFLVAVAALYISEHTPNFGVNAFRPVAVPGDTGASVVAVAADGQFNTPEGQEYRTNWTLFTVGKPTARDAAAVQFFVGLDGLNVWLVLLTSLLTYVAVVLSWHSAREKAGGYYAWVFVLQSAVTGAFVSFDVLLFYVFFELTLIPTFFLIGGWGVGGGKRDAARKFFLYTLFGSLFTLVGLIGIVYTNPGFSTVERNVIDPKVPMPHGSVSFNVNRLMMNVMQRYDAHDRRVKEATAQAEAKEKELDDKRKQNAADLAPFQKAAEDARKLAAEVTAARDSHSATQTWLFFALIAGFVVKVPLVPFHTWLPGAYSEAPAPITLLLSALLAKLGTLGMLRIVIPLCPDAAVQYGLPVFGTLGAIGVVYAAFCAVAQKDVKLMAAYSSVSHLGLLVMGLFAQNAEGLSGAALHMVNHGLTAGATFGLLAVLYDRYRTTDMTQLGGLWAKYPKFTFFMVLVCLASVGLPGLNNFVTEMLILGGLFKPWAVGTVGYWLPVAGAAGILLSAWYTFTMLKAVFFGPLKEPASVPAGVPTGDLSGRELWALALPAVGCVVLGLFPQPFLNVMKYDLWVVENQANYARERINPPLAAAESPHLQPQKLPDNAPLPQPAGGPAPRPAPRPML